MDEPEHAELTWISHLNEDAAYDTCLRLLRSKQQACQDDLQLNMTYHISN